MSFSTRNIYIVSAVRTPLGKFGKTFSRLTAADLGAIAIKNALLAAGVASTDIDFIIMGHVLRAGTGQDTARQASLKAGIPPSVDAMNVDQVCSSGMSAVITAFTFIKSGEADIVVAGGMENMSNTPFLIPSAARWGIRHLITRKMELIDSMFYDGLFDNIANMGMGEEADKVARERGYKREELDEIAYISHQRAKDSSNRGFFKREIVPISITSRGREEIIDIDETIRQDVTLEKLSQLPPAFGPEGLHTAGSSSQLADGAAALVLASERAVDEFGLKPIARILGFSMAGVDTWRFVEAPPVAVKKLLEKLDMSISEIDYFENNEAFAVSSLVFRDELGVDLDRVNVFGGSIALGHPLGATGARIIVTLLNVLKTRGGRRGVAALCHGLGGATAIAVELV